MVISAQVSIEALQGDKLEASPTASTSAPCILTTDVHRHRWWWLPIRRSALPRRLAAIAWWYRMRMALVALAAPLARLVGQSGCDGRRKTVEGDIA